MIYYRLNGVQYLIYAYTNIAYLMTKRGNNLMVVKQNVMRFIKIGYNDPIITKR